MSSEFDPTEEPDMQPGDDADSGDVQEGALGGVMGHKVPLLMAGAAVLVALIVGAVVGAIAGGSGKVPRSELDLAKANLSAAREELAELSEWSGAKHKDLSRTIDEITAERDALLEDIDQASAGAREVAEKEADLEEKAELLDAREAELQALEAELEERRQAGTDAPEQSEMDIPGGGTYLIGDDIEPGTYRSLSDSGTCYWGRLSGRDGSLDSLIENGLGEGQAVVTIEPDDVAFETSMCGGWKKID